MMYVHTAAKTNQTALTSSPRTMAIITQAKPPSRAIDQVGDPRGRGQRNPLPDATGG